MTNDIKEYNCIMPGCKRKVYIDGIYCTQRHQKEHEKIEAIKELKQYFEKSNYITYTKLNHCSRSGMLRHISVYVIIDNSPICIDHLISRLGQYTRVPFNKGEGLKTYGCGMDMGFDIVYNTSRIVFKDGFMCRGERCPANDHVNGDNNRTPHLHTDSGYCLIHRWL